MYDLHKKYHKAIKLEQYIDICLSWLFKYLCWTYEEIGIFEHPFEM